jgi:hypothetical protein
MRDRDVLPIDSDDERVIFIDCGFCETGSSVFETRFDANPVE